MDYASAEVVQIPVPPPGLEAIRWQGVLDAQDDVFAEVDARVRVALVPRHVLESDGTRRSVVQRRCDPAPMLLWEPRSGRLAARAALFGGLDDLEADLLFVGNDGAFDAVLRHASPFGEMKRRIGSGAIQLFVLRSRETLRELGYEDFLELLGLPFLGACR